MRIGSLFIFIAIVATTTSAYSDHIDGAPPTAPKCNILQYRNSIAEFERQATNGSAEQMYCIGYYHYIVAGNKKAVDPDSDRHALKWFKKSAKLGLADAAYRVGEMYMKGFGVSRDYELAVEWFLKSSQMGDHNSGASIADLFFKGKGFHGRYTPYSPEWYREAGKLSKRASGFGPIFTHYGKKNENRQFEFLKNSAKAGIVTAQHDLAYYYDTHDKLVKNEMNAAKWYEIAARNGHLWAKSVIATRYAEGDGIQKNFVLAYAWYNVAVVGGENLSKAWRDKLEQKMTPSQIEEAQKLTLRLLDQVK